MKELIQREKLLATQRESSGLLGLLRLSVGDNCISLTLGPLPIYIICHHGNDSQKAVKVLQNFFSPNDNLIVRDIVGGLSEWSKSVDPTFPEY